MKSKAMLISSSILVAAWMNSGTVFGQSSGTNGTTIHPPINGPEGSVGGSKSERGSGNVPLPEGSRQGGTVEMGKSGSTAGSSTASIMAVQQALKDKGYDPGPIDGKMNSKTQSALKSFQSASSLPATGVLDSGTANKLGVSSSSSSSSSSSRASSYDNSSSSSRSSMKSSDTTVGKDTDQPNQAPSRK
jgi:peptidoglycan hydrolase-like protein with peptidoglycan-binding domain